MVKKWLKSVHIYGSYRKNNTGVPFFWTTLYISPVDLTAVDYMLLILIFCVS